jgi:hypothetical protein
MTTEFRGVDIENPEHWQDYATVLDFHLANASDTGMDTAEPEFFSGLRENNPEAAWQLLGFLARHESAYVRKQASIEAVDYLAEKGEAALEIVLEGLPEAAKAGGGDSAFSYLRDVLEEGSGELVGVDLPILATLIRAYNEAKADFEVSQEARQTQEELADVPRPQHTMRYAPQSEAD